MATLAPKPPTSAIDHAKDEHTQRLSAIEPCPCCGASMIYTPIVLCSECGKRLPIKCYVYSRDGRFYGECLTFSLISRGDTREEAIIRLQRSMFAYVEAVLSDGKPTKGLIPRPAPAFSWVRYFLYTWRRSIAHRIFGVPDPLAMKIIPDSKAIAFKVVEC